MTVYRKTGHNAAPFEKIFCCTYRVVGVQILSSPSFIVVASVVPTIIDLTVPFRRLDTILFKEIDRSFLDIYARRVVPGFPVDGHIYIAYETYTKI